MKDDSLKLCPCCRAEEETQHHFMRCSLNPSFQTSLNTLRSDILVADDVHPVRYLLADGFSHFSCSATQYSPLTSQYPSHFQDMIREAMATQNLIGCPHSMKGYLAKQWGTLAQHHMDHTGRDHIKGAKRMKQIVCALSSHLQRLWLSRNEVLHSPSADQTLDSIRSAESAEILYYHSRPHLLRTGDQHYCNRPLSVILAAKPATRRRWLRKVKQSSAELTKDGTHQTLLTNYFRIQ